MFARNRRGTILNFLSNQKNAIAEFQHHPLHLMNRIWCTSFVLLSALSHATDPLCACRASRCAHYDDSFVLVEARRCLVPLSECRDNPETVCALPRVCLCEPCAEETTESHSCGIVSQIWVTNSSDRRPCEVYDSSLAPSTTASCEFSSRWWLSYFAHGVWFYATDPTQWPSIPQRTLDASRFLWS